MKRISIFEELNREKQKAEHYKKEADEWQKKYSEIEKKFKELEKKFNQLLNSNTPTSNIPSYLKQYSIIRPERGSNKRGKPKGGNGGSRKAPKHHDEKVEAKAKSCPQCNSRKIKKKDKYYFTIYDLPVLKLIKRLATVFVYCCKDCGCEFEGTHPLVPLKGQIGPRLQSFFTVLKHHFGGAYGKISEFTNDLLEESFSPNAINDVVSNVASTLKPSYDKIREKVKEAKVKQSDETGWPVNGNSWWLWVAITVSYVYVWIDEFRSSKVLDKIFGVAEDFVGVLVSDCFSAYHAFKVVSQKCWLHLLRKAKFEAKKAPKKDISNLYVLLHEMYNSMTEFLKRNPDKSQRIWQAILYKQKLERICNVKWKSEQAIGLVKRIKKYNHQWLVGIILPEVPLHNNDNERHIKALILPRKVCGGHRTEEGAKNFAIIASHLQTWRKRGHSQFKQLCEHLSDAYAGLTPSI